MQEEVENRTVNLAISTTKLTGRSLVNAFRAYMNHRRNVKARKAAIQDTHIVGEQTIDQLLGQNQGATNIEIEKTEIAGFKRILNKYGVDYAITKDRSQEPPRYLVFFKARDGDALTAAFKEYSAAMAKKAERPSMLELLAKMKVLVASLPRKVREKAAVDYLNSLGIAVEDLSDYSHKEIKEAAKTIDAGESNPLTEEILSLIPENKEPLDTPTQVTSEQIKELTPTMTREDVLSLLGDTQDVGSGIYIYLYEVDQQYLLRIPFASDEAQLGVTGEDLLKALVPISGDIAPMVYVNDTLYQIVDSQPNFADEKSSFNLLGKIENTVSSSEEPKENFQANDDIVGAAVYQYGDNIVVEFEGKYWLYEHYHNTDFDGNSD